MKTLILSALLSISLSMNAQSDTLGNCVLETTLLTSTASEFNWILNLMTNATHTQHHVGTDLEMVLYFKQERDTVLVRYVSRGTDEEYKIFIR